jgi:hypothetical protein
MLQKLFEESSGKKSKNIQSSLIAFMKRLDKLKLNKEQKELGHTFIRALWHTI